MKTCRHSSDKVTNTEKAASFGAVFLQKHPFREILKRFSVLII